MKEMKWLTPLGQKLYQQFSKIYCNLDDCKLAAAADAYATIMESTETLSEEGMVMNGKAHPLLEVKHRCLTLFLRITRNEEVSGDGDDVDEWYAQRESK